MSWWNKFKKSWLEGAKTIKAMQMAPVYDFTPKTKKIDFEYDWTGRVRFTSTLDGEIWLNKNDLIQLIESNKHMSIHLQIFQNRLKGICPRSSTNRI